ncbi:MAG: hypothetical protein K0R46_2687 [Herbinix sp.]|jgi:hypothetical protein|nr:hypothetical protein [Herbinix sp.]
MMSLLIIKVIELIRKTTSLNKKCQVRTKPLWYVVTIILSGIDEVFAAKQPYFIRVN